MEKKSPNLKGQTWNLGPVKGKSWGPWMLLFHWIIWVGLGLSITFFPLSILLKPVFVASYAFWEFGHNAISPPMRTACRRVIWMISLICRKTSCGIKLSIFVLSSHVCQATQRYLGGFISLTEAEGSGRIIGFYYCLKRKLIFKIWQGPLREFFINTICVLCFSLSLANVRAWFSWWQCNLATSGNSLHWLLSPRQPLCVKGSRDSAESLAHEYLSRNEKCDWLVQDLLLFSANISLWCDWTQGKSCCGECGGNVSICGRAFPQDWTFFYCSAS